MRTRQVFVVPQFHCDVVWRRPPEEQVAIRARQFDSALDMLGRCPEFRFEFDQATIVREYVARRPHRLAQMRRFLRQGRLDITGGQETIPDTNMPAGEALVRNILLGRLWFEETLGARPVVANMDDAFGQTAQLPQIFAGFGYRYFRDARTPGLDAALARRGILWEGLDGSRIFYLPKHAFITLHTHVCNLPIVYEPLERARTSLEDALKMDLPVVYCDYGSEEDLVIDEVVDLVRRARPPRGVSVRFGLAREVLEAARRHNRRPPVVRGEFNPSQPGTHITRIRLKQAYRQAEWATLAAETAATCAAVQGHPYPHATLTALWRRLAYVQFHDSLCGCHIDAVNRRVMGYCRAVSRAAGRLGWQALRALAPSRGRSAGLLLFNPLLAARREPMELDLPAGVTLAGADGQPLPAERRAGRTLVLADLAPLAVTAFRLVRAPAPRPILRPTAGPSLAKRREIAVGPYRVTADDGKVTVVHRAWKRTLIDGSLPQVRFREEDGTLWDERFLGPVFTEQDGQQHLVRREDGPVSLRLVWRGEVRGDRSAETLPPVWKAMHDGRRRVFGDLERLAWEKEVIFYHQTDRIDVVVRLDFRGRNTEVLLGFPVCLDPARAHPRYEVPFGVVERRPYFEVPASSPQRHGAPVHLAALGGKGAWPALTWVAYGDHRGGLVLANRGTPSHRLMGNLIEVGVLRSPTSKASGFTPSASARENGRHEFIFAIRPYRGPDPTRDRACLLGAYLNARPLVQEARVGDLSARPYLDLKAPGVMLSAWKKAERRPGFVLRTYETAGRPARGRLSTGFPLARVEEVDLMEQPIREADPADLRWRPFEIKTLYLEAAADRDCRPVGRGR